MEATHLKVGITGPEGGGGGGGFHRERKCSFYLRLTETRPKGWFPTRPVRRAGFQLTTNNITNSSPRSRTNMRRGTSWVSFTRDRGVIRRLLTASSPLYASSLLLPSDLTVSLSGNCSLDWVEHCGLDSLKL